MAVRTFLVLAAAHFGASCATTRARDVYLFHGPEPTLDAFVAASGHCGYSRVEKTLGNHLEPMIILTVPNEGTREFSCVLNWAKAHERDGLTDQLPDRY